VLSSLVREEDPLYLEKVKIVSDTGEVFGKVGRTISETKGI